MVWGEAERYQQIVESVHEGIYTVDCSARLTFANARLAAMLGYPREALVGRSIFRFVMPTDRGQAISRWRTPGRPGEQWEMRLRRRDNSPLWTLASGRPLHDEQGVWLGTLGMLTDITMRKQLEERLRQAEADRESFTRQVLEAVTGGRFHLVEAEQIPAWGPLLCDLTLDDRSRFRTLMETVERTAAQHGMSQERAADYLLGISEAVGNAVKHARQARGQVRCGVDCMGVRILDRGPGIQAEKLPASVLQPGFSTAVSLGMGYAVMLEMCDGIWLATGPHGTSLQLDKLYQPAPGDLQSLLDRF